MPGAGVLNKRLYELEQLVKQYPIDIPLIEAAKFLHMHPESLRCAIVQGTAGFAALAWQKPGAKNRGFLIPTLSFYQAITGGALTNQKNLS